MNIRSVVTLIAAAYFGVANGQVDLCFLHTNSYLQQFELGAEWALQMYDSSTKLPDGILMGGMPQLGNYDECLQVRAPDGFVGQYCRVKLNLTRINGTGDGFNYLQFAVCAPSSCDASGVEDFTERLLDKLYTALNLEVSAEVIPDSCFYQGSSQLDAGFWTTISVFSLVFLVVVAMTVLEFIHKSQWLFLKGFAVPPSMSKALFSFSLHKNMSELWSVRASSRGTLPCLHGMRALSIAWVILGHRYVMELGAPTVNLRHAYEMVRFDWTAMPIMNAYLSVDTFFFMAGLLTCYIFMMETDKGRPFKPLRYLAMRYLRLTPALLVCVLFLMYVVMHVTNGPQWGTATKPMADTCKDNWWLTLLYVNNYVNFDRLCVSHSWYLSIDMQLAFLAPLMFVPLRRWPRPTALCLTVLTLALCFFTFTKTYLGNYWWTLVLIPLEGVNYDFLAEIYVKTPHRASPYIVGLGVGYIIAKNIRCKPNVNKIWVWLGWLICTVASLTIVYSVGISYAENYEYSTVDAAFYNGFHRLGWALCLSWIVLACSFGYGGPVNNFLSWPGWQPFSRLAYCGYLVHFPFMYMQIGFARNPIFYSHFRLVHRFFSDIFTTILMASVLYLTVEAPVNNLLRILFNKDRQSPVGKVADSPQNDVQVNNSVNKISVEQKDC